MTHNADRQFDAGTRINYAIADCDLGKLLVATTNKGICAVTLGDSSIKLIENLQTEFVKATTIVENQDRRDWIERILKSLEGKEVDRDLPLDIRGTAFQQQVWQALKKIPYGETRTYKNIADELNKPKATRAVGNACGTNPVALIIPCHRVLRSDGSLGGYRWGLDRKRKLLVMEQQHQQTSLF